MAEKNVDLHKHTHKHTQTHTNTHKQTEKVVQGTLPPRTRSKMKLFFLRKPRKKRLKRCALRAPHYHVYLVISHGRVLAFPELYTNTVRRGVSPGI